MAALESNSTSGDRKVRTKRIGPTILALCCAAAIMADVVHRRTQEPERLTERGLGSSIYGGRLYGVIEGGAMLVSQTIHGADFRTVSQEPGSIISLLHTDQAVFPDTLLYAVTTRPTLAPRFDAQGIHAADSSSTRNIQYPIQHFIQHLGEFIAPVRDQDKAEPAHTKRSVFHSSPTHPSPLRIKAVNTRTGEIRDVAAITNSGVSAIVGTKLYWIKYEREDRVNCVNNNQYWTEVTGHSELWETSLVNGSSKRLSSNLPRSTAVWAGTNGVMWAKLRTYPDSHKDLYYWRETESRPHRIVNMTDDLESSTPVEYHNMLYWFACDNPEARSLTSLWTADRLVCSDLDGSNRRDVAVLSNLNRQALSWRYYNKGPVLYHDALYCILKTSAHGNAPDKEDAQLCRIHPERKDPIEFLCRIPPISSDIQVIDGYLYFTMQELVRSRWAKLASDDSAVAWTNTLCRMKFSD